MKSAAPGILYLSFTKPRRLSFVPLRIKSLRYQSQAHPPGIRPFSNGCPAFETILIYLVAVPSWVLKRADGLVFSGMSWLAMELKRNQNPDFVNPKGSAARKG